MTKRLKVTTTATTISTTHAIAGTLQWQGHHGWPGLLFTPVLGIVCQVIGVTETQWKFPSFHLMPCHTYNLINCVTEECLPLPSKKEAWPYRTKVCLLPCGASSKPLAWGLLTCLRAEVAPILFNLAGWIHVILFVLVKFYSSMQMSFLVEKFTTTWNKHLSVSSTVFSPTTQEVTSNVVVQDPCVD